jgi:hypothetical protein
MTSVNLGVDPNPIEGKSKGAAKGYKLYQPVRRSYLWQKDLGYKGAPVGLSFESKGRTSQEKYLTIELPHPRSVQNQRLPRLEGCEKVSYQLREPGPSLCPRVPQHEDSKPSTQ